MGDHAEHRRRHCRRHQDFSPNQTLSTLISNRMSMENDYNQSHQHLHNPNHHHHHHLYLPIFCKSSLKDVFRRRSPSSSSAAASAADEPLSPRVSCVGNVKRSSRVIGFPIIPHKLFSNPTTPHANPHNQSDNFNYRKLKRFFSAKNLICTATLAAATAAPKTSCAPTGHRRQRIVDRDRKSKPRDGDWSGRSSSTINIVDLDPPLPVPPIKRFEHSGDGEEAVSLWKRRSGGMDLKGLQIQQIGIPKHSFQPLSV